MSRVQILITALLLAACGGGGSEPTTPPPPSPTTVTRVALVSDTATLVAAQTRQLTAQALDQSGASLTGRAITWTSSSASVASVSGGLVTGVGPGSATVIASVDGKADTATVTVLDGAVVGAAGGSASFVGGAARVTIPAGALSTDRPISISRITTPVADARLVTGTAFEFGPSGTFASPVTLALRYEAGSLPTGASATTLRLHRLTSGAWIEVPGSSVDTVARTVTGPTGSFSSYAVLAGASAQETMITLTKLGPTCSLPGNCGISGINIWTVPADVYQATFDLYGASGGGNAGAGLGGKGGRTTATIQVFPGEQLQIRLGGAGNRVNASNGGGRGGDGGAYRALIADTIAILYRDGRSGGGATDVRRGVPNLINAPGLHGRILVAGGGGGDGGPSIRLFDAVSTTFVVDDPGARGGDGGLSASRGADGLSYVTEGFVYSSATGGNPGTQTTYGTGGASSSAGVAKYLTPGDAGTLLNGGGNGGSDNNPLNVGHVRRGAGGGGGGGGWFAGGGGGPSWEYPQSGAGGGGGSSYGPQGANFATGVNVGDGRAVITFTPSPGRTPTQVTTTISPSGATSQQQITVSAVLSLAPPLSGPIVGPLRLVVDNQPIAGGTVIADAAGRVTFPAISLTAGIHTISVMHDGTSALGASVSTVELTVRP